MNFGVSKTVVHGQCFAFVEVFVQPERGPHTITPEIAPNWNVQRKLWETVGKFSKCCASVVGNALVELFPLVVLLLKMFHRICEPPDKKPSTRGQIPSVLGPNFVFIGSGFHFAEAAGAHD